MNRAAVFIEGGYLEKLMVAIGRPRLDFEKFSNLLCGQSERFRSYYYHCLPWCDTPATESQAVNRRNREGFFTALGKLRRFEVKQGKIARRGTHPDWIYEQKRVDILLGVDLVRLSAKNSISEAHLVAGDSDFLPAVEYAKQDGVIIKLWHGPRGTYHQEIWHCCDERQELDAAFFGTCLL